MYNFETKFWTLFSLFFALINCQILQRQYITTGHQLQAPVRRINIPLDLLRNGSKSDKRPEAFDDSLHRQCPQCLDKRLVQHYMARHCIPMIKAGCGCPSRYDCPITSLPNDSKFCWFKGKAYELGSEVKTYNRCQVCKCSSLSSNDPIVCTSLQCPTHTKVTTNGDNQCYSHTKCCPQHDCPHSYSNKNVCKYRGISYRFGQQISTDDNKCLSCICGEEWDDSNPLDSYSCRKVECDLELDSRFRSGCTPIYASDRCCPIDYNCPKSNRLSIRGLESESQMCAFETRKYPIGSTLYTNKKCIQCICEIPPQFTCIRKDNCI